MRRKRLPPMPPAPPEGHMFWANQVWKIEDFEFYVRSGYSMTRYPTWREDPSYNWRETTKKSKQRSE